MFKSLILIFLLFLISGCSLQPGQSGFVNEKNAQGMSNFNENTVKQRIDLIRSGLTANIKPGKKSSADSITAASQQENAATDNRIQLEDLASQFFNRSGKQ